MVSGEIEPFSEARNACQSILRLSVWVSPATIALRISSAEYTGQAR